MYTSLAVLTLNVGPILICCAHIYSSPKYVHEHVHVKCNVLIHAHVDVLHAAAPAACSVQEFAFAAAVLESPSSAPCAVSFFSVV